MFVNSVRFMIDKIVKSAKYDCYEHYYYAKFCIITFALINITSLQKLKPINNCSL